MHLAYCVQGGLVERLTTLALNTGPSYAGRMARKRYPRRIQRKRTKNWKMPKNAVYVGRPGKWGNPFFRLKEQPDMAVDRGFVVAVYKLWLNDQLVPGLAALFKGGDTLPPPPSAETIQQHLKGKNLACWCPLDDDCHADVLLTVANEAGQEG